MKTCIDVLLRFDIPTLDGRIVGSGRMTTWVVNGLPRIGERIMPCTGRSDMSMALERYDIRVIDACRNVGGDYTQVFLCEVRLATWSPHSGRSYGASNPTSMDVLNDWTHLRDRFKTMWQDERQEGTVIPVLDIANK